MTDRAVHADEQWRDLSVPRLIRGLRALAEPEERADRAALAALRRGLGKRPGEAPEMFPVLIPLLPQGRLRQWDERCAYTVAALFAMHPASWDGAQDGRRRRNFGASMRRLRDATDSDGPERRMVALLNSDSDDLPEHLRGLVALLRGQDVPVDWNQLTYDLLAWNLASREAQRRWASAFWGQSERSAEASDPNTDSTE
jgi:CRISPR system Cascade subunit CasB